MARTLLGEHQIQQDREQKPGGNIQLANNTFDPSNSDLRTLSRRIYQNMSANTRDVLAYALTLKGIAESSATFADRYHGFVYLPFDADSVKIRVWGQNCQIRVSMDGQVVATVTCTGTLQWYSSSAVKLSSISVTNPESGMIVLVEGRDNTTAGTHYCVMIEHDGPITSTTDLDTIMDSGRAGALDDNAFNADTPLSCFLGQRLMNSARHVAFERNPGTLIMHPIGDPLEFSSIGWRADGPYAVQVPPWCDTARIVVTCEATDHDVNVTAFVEGERWEDAEGRAVTVTAGAGKGDEIFSDLPIPRRGPLGWSTVNVYVAFRSEPGTTQFSNVALADIYSQGQIKLNTNLQSNIPGPHGLYLVLITNNEVDFNQTPKPNWSYGDGETLHDIAGVEYDASGAVWLSPNVNLVPYANQTTSGTPYRIVSMGVLTVYGVWCGAYPSSARRDQTTFKPGIPPQAGLIQETARLCNSLSRYGTAQIATRHMGNTWMVDAANHTVSSAPPKLGRWLHAVYDTDWQHVLVVPVPRLPNPASPSSEAITVASFYAQAQFLAVNDSTRPGLTVANTEWRLVLDTDPRQVTHASYAGTLRETGATEDAAAELFRADLLGPYGRTFTVWDMIQTLRMKTSRDTGGDDYEHDYTQQVSWPEEVIRARLWDLSPACKVDVHATSANYPLFLKLQVKIAEANANIVVVGAHAWIGERT